MTDDSQPTDADRWFDLVMHHLTPDSRMGRELQMYKELGEAMNILARRRNEGEENRMFQNDRLSHQ